MLGSKDLLMNASKQTNIRMLQHYNYVMSSNAHTLKAKSNFKKGWMIMYLVKKNAKKYIANNLIRAHHTK